MVIYPQSILRVYSIQEELIMNTQTTETTYVIDGQVVSEAAYHAWLEIRRGGSGF